MPTLRASDLDEELAKRASALAAPLTINGNQVARWRDKSLLPTKRHGFGGPVGYTDEAARTAACIAAVLEEDRTAHHRPRLSEAAVLCFGRGCAVRFAGLRGAFRSEFVRVRAA